jgi:IS5 family transposase
MTNAYVEYRPKSDVQTHGVTHHVVIADGKEVGERHTTQLSAEKWACAKGYTVHVARERHRQHQPTPAHWRKSDCKA